MRLGITLGASGGDLADLVPLARQAEAAGFDTVSCGEAGHDTFALTAVVAAVTTRVRVLSGAATWARPPVVTARAVATVDALATGRYELGLGTMPPAWNERFHGIPWDRPLSRMREYVEVVRGALAATPDAPLHHDGRCFRVDGYVPIHPPPRPRVPLHLAVTRPGMARLAGEIADGALVNVIHTTRSLGQVLRPALADGADRVGGRAVEVGVMVRCAVGGDPAEVLRRGRHSLAMYLEVPYFRELAAAEGFDLPADVTVERLPEELVRRMSLLGTADEVRAQLHRYDGLADWVLLTPPGGVRGAALREATEAILSAFA